VCEVRGAWCVCVCVYVCVCLCYMEDVSVCFCERGEFSDTCIIYIHTHEQKCEHKFNAYTHTRPHTNTHTHTRTHTHTHIHTRIHSTQGAYTTPVAFPWKLLDLSSESRPTWLKLKSDDVSKVRSANRSDFGHL